jgi:hypothetical protein
MAIIPKAIDRFNTISTKIQITLFTEIEKTILKFIWKHRRLLTAKTNLNKKGNARSITIPDFKLHYWTSAKKHYWHKNRHAV